jgi:hypothetical protein
MKIKFKNSYQYWNDRYLNEGNSGPGSYGRLSLFKADIINSLLSALNIQNSIEFGCGDGNQLSLINYKDYVGYDIAEKSITICKEKFKNSSNKKFFLFSEYDGRTADLSVSLDVLFHLIEDHIFINYLEKLFNSSNKYVIIYSSNSNEFGKTALHVKHRNFLDYIDKEKWELFKFIKNKYPYDKEDPNNTSFCDFFIFKKIL